MSARTRRVVEREVEQERLEKERQEEEKRKIVHKAEEKNIKCKEEVILRKSLVWLCLGGWWIGGGLMALLRTGAPDWSAPLERGREEGTYKAVKVRRPPAVLNRL